MSKQDIAELKEYVSEEVQGILPEFDDADYEDLKLSPQQLLFAYYYVLDDFNEASAYAKSYSEDDVQKCKVKGKILLKNQKVVTAYNRILDAVWQQASKTLPHKILVQLQKESSCDVYDYYNDDFTPRPLSSISKEKRVLIDNIILVIDKFGKSHVTYALPDKKKVTSILLEILKIRQMTSAGDIDLGNTAENKLMIDSIFNKEIK